MRKIFPGKEQHATFIPLSSQAGGGDVLLHSKYNTKPLTADQRRKNRKFRTE